MDVMDFFSSKSIEFDHALNGYSAFGTGCDILNSLTSHDPSDIPRVLEHWVETCTLKGYNLEPVRAIFSPLTAVRSFREWLTSQPDSVQAYYAHPRNMTETYEQLGREIVLSGAISSALRDDNCSSSLQSEVYRLCYNASEVPSLIHSIGYDEQVAIQKMIENDDESWKWTTPLLERCDVLAQKVAKCGTETHTRMDKAIYRI